ncbi:MAG: Ig-like domain-containing protein [Limisphaerales bacterium]
MLSNPAHGTLSGTATNLTYTPTGTNFTGTDTFNYMVYSGCGGDFATNSVTITVGDATTYPNPQSVMTGTNRAVAISLSAADFDNCNADTNYYTYTVTSNPPTVI